MSNQNYYSLQKAIYEKLTSSTVLMALVSGIFDHVPQSSAFPYITIGEVVIHDFANLLKAGNDYQLNINIWSREAGHKQIADISEIIYGLLHNGNLAVAGKNLLIMRVVSNNMQLENDGATYKVSLKLQVVLVDS